MPITATTTIDRPREEVFAAFRDLDRAAQRIEGITAVEVLEGPAQLDVGTRWRETRSMFGKEASEVMQVTALQAPDSYRVEADSHATRCVSEFRFDEVDPDTTRVTMSFAGKPTTLVSKLMTPLGWAFRGATRRMLQQDLDDLKAAIERAGS